MSKQAKWTVVVVMAILTMVANQCIFTIVNLHEGVADFLMAFVCMLFNGWAIMDMYDLIKER